MRRDRLTPMGERISEGMPGSGIRSEAELARRLGVSHQTVQRWLYEPLAHVDASTLFRLADTIHLSARYILTGEGSPTPRAAVLPNEARLLDEYRRLPMSAQAILLHAAINLTATEQ